VTQVDDRSVFRDKAATVHDVARVAGVSAQTVSRLLKGYEGIRPKTREKVEAAIAQLEYRPNHIARLLRTRKSTRIGVVVHEMFAYGPARLLRGAAARAREAGYSLNIIGVDGEDERSVRDAFETFEEEQVAGIMAITLTDSVRSVVDNRTSEVPILVDPAEAGVNGPSFNELGARLVAQHFLELGHRRVGIVLGPENWLPARQRRDGFERTIEGAGAEFVILGEGDWSPTAGARAADFFNVGDGITAVFAANDAMAMGFMRRLADRGISVPGTVSVAGFDGVPEGEFFTPSLTTVQADYEWQGQAAVDALLGEISGTPFERDQRLHVDLVRRQSTRSAIR
jgi:DNA-binding LacI/PurR family transcriptional regulator